MARAPSNRTTTTTPRAVDMVHVSLAAGAHAVVRKGRTAELDNVVGLIAEQKRAAR